MRELPASWEDEPWPLDDPVPGPSLRPSNWSDSHDNVPQVADLADEAWQRAVDRGISLERALAEIQDEHFVNNYTPPPPTPVRVSVVSGEDEYRVFGGSRHGTVMACAPGADRTLVPVTSRINCLITWTDPSPIAPAFDVETYILRKFACPEVGEERIVGRFLVHEDFDLDLVIAECEAVLGLTRLLGATK